MTISTGEEVRDFFKNLQDEICSALENTDGESLFTEDTWAHHNGGGGRTRILCQGAIFEQAGVNFSHVRGDQLPTAATVHRPALAGCKYEAMGVSLVIHPLNPYVPTAHMNVRFFTTSTSGKDEVWWFGGGFDLTPYYGFKEDAVHWHRTAREALRPFGEHLYPRMKKWCDEYFVLGHRGEQRGIGGLFYDDFNEGGFDNSFGLTRSVGEHFLPAYLPIVKQRYTTPYGTNELEFQRYRRGRYVEFNLVYDRGTLFGLQSGGRTESVLMSLPPEVSWRYNWQPTPGSAEEALYLQFLRPRDWLEDQS